MVCLGQPVDVSCGHPVVVVCCGHPVVVVLVCTECCRSSAESLTELAGGSRELRGEDCLLLHGERREERESPHN